jgi:hypothetical protein
LPLAPAMIEVSASHAVDDDVESPQASEQILKEVTLQVEMLRMPHPRDGCLDIGATTNSFQSRPELGLEHCRMRWFVELTQVQQRRVALDGVGQFRDELGRKLIIGTRA